MQSKVAISVGHDAAAEIALDVLKAGGNAVDAGVAASIALCVLHSEQVQLGGVAPMLVRMAGDDTVHCVEGAGRWPANADRELFERNHRGRIPKGVLRTVVPAAPDAWLTALSQFGTMRFAELAEPVWRLAKDGFPAHDDLVSCSAQFERDYRKFLGNAAIWLPNDRPIEKGEQFTQPDLARTIAALIDADRSASGREEGLHAVRSVFYEGDIAKAMVRHVANNGGWLQASDLATHQTPVVRATQATVVGGTLHTCGAWSQGPALTQALQILEQSDAGGLDPDSVEFMHRALEALKLAFADRDAFYGDPDFVDTPLSTLLSVDHARKRAARISPNLAIEGVPGVENRSVEKTLDTSVVSIVDSTGNVFVATPSDTSFDAPVVPGLGFVISTRGAQSRVEPDHPAVLQPGKRPRVSACPFLFEAADGRLIAGGGPGADLQLQASAQVLARHLLCGEPLEVAIAAPRAFTQSAPGSTAPHLCFPGKVTVEEDAPEGWIDALNALGHKAVSGSATGIGRPSMCVVATEADGSARSAYGDPRRESGQRIEVAG